MKRIGHRMEIVAAAVKRHPGQTAHALRENVFPANRQQVMARLYNAFFRASKAGLIRSERRGHVTVYFPAEASR